MTPSTQSDRLLLALKEALRGAGVTYADVASHLGLSLSAVKRQLSKGGITLERLERIGELAGTDLLELARRAEDARGRLSQLTVDQESALAGDEALLLSAVCVLNRWTIGDLREVYGFSEPEAIGLLAKLDRLGLIELLPGNRVRLRTARNFAWRPNGPIHRYFVEQHQQAFLRGAFGSPSEVYQFRFGMVSSESAKELMRSIQALLEQFQALSSRDEVLPRGSGAGTCLLVAMREWEPRYFAQLKSKAVSNQAS